MRDYYLGESGRKYYQQRNLSRRTRAQRDVAQLFQPYVSAGSTVLDFGCGTGEVLKHLRCRGRLGVEINELSMKEARDNGIEVFTSLDDVANGRCDVAISNHALEHVQAPFSILRALHDKLIPRGILVVVVPYENPLSRHARRWNRLDTSQHLYNWTPLNLGNLIKAAGFEVLESRLIMKGQSRFVEPLACVQPLYSFAQRVVFFLKSRGHVLCVGRKGT